MTPVAQQLAAVFAGLTLGDVPESARHAARRDLLDAAGLCVAARRTDYIASLVASWDGAGRTTAIGHPGGRDPAAAAVLNGTAIHGEDFDDTLEGAPIRVGAMVIPAVLAVAEQYGRSGADVLRGVVCGLETICRINHVVPGAIHRAGFHPVSVLGPFGAAVGAGVALGLDEQQLTHALGVAGSMSSGIGEFLTDGAWTKRFHPGWAAQSGLRAALMGRAGFFGPPTVLDGPRNVFHAFGPTGTPRYEPLLDGLGRTWLMQDIAFKPYACGTMIHPYIDCMIEMERDGILAEDIVEVECEVGEGPVPRLWEPLSAKHAPSSGYAAKFSMPFGMAVGFHDGDAGLAQFTDARVRDPRVLALASKIRYVVDPDNPYPDDYTGHIAVRLRDGRRLEYRRPHFRGGRHAPLSDAELIAKFHGNVGYGGWSTARGEDLLQFVLAIESHDDVAALAQFRGD